MQFCQIGIAHRLALFAAIILSVTGPIIARQTIDTKGVGNAMLLLGRVTGVSQLRSSEDVSQVWPTVDPSGQHLMVCGLEQDLRKNTRTGFVYASSDAGKSWHRTMMENGTAWVSEESCTFSGQGRAYFTAGESDMSTGNPRHTFGHLNVFASNDYGMNWNRIWKRKEGWIDWTYLAAVPASQRFPSSLIVFGNYGADKPGHIMWDSRPVAIVSHDNGRSFSNLISPTPSPRFRYVFVWASGSEVLPDGTALFSTATASRKPEDSITSGTWWSNPLRVEIFAYSSSRETLRLRAVVRSTSHSLIFTVAMGQDRSHGRFNGRLYVAWIESKDRNVTNRTGTLWLATSDDLGYHWFARPVLPVGCLRDIKLSVAPDGTLGVIWLEDKQRLRFATSKDGGQTFSKSIVVSDNKIAPLRATSAAVSEYWAAEAGHPSKSALYNDDKHLGVSIRLIPTSGIGDYAIAAGTNDFFHAFWAQAQSDGTHVLFTRSIRVAIKARGIGSMLTGAAARVCSDSSGRGNPAEPKAMPSLQPIGEHDISASFSLQVRDAHYDSNTQVASMNITLTNKGMSVITGPLALFGIALHGDYGTVVAENETGVLQDQPFWDISRTVPEKVLQPGASSAPFTLRFKISHFRMLRNGGEGGDAASMLVRIYQ